MNVLSWNIRKVGFKVSSQKHLSSQAIGHLLLRANRLPRGRPGRVVPGGDDRPLQQRGGVCRAPPRGSPDPRHAEHPGQSKQPRDVHAGRRVADGVCGRQRHRHPGNVTATVCEHDEQHGDRVLRDAAHCLGPVV